MGSVEFISGQLPDASLPPEMPEPEGIRKRMAPLTLPTPAQAPTVPVNPPAESGAGDGADPE
jgi:hypothetical protein